MTKTELPNSDETATVQEKNLLTISVHEIVDQHFLTKGHFSNAHRIQSAFALSRP